jgi:hypothetical protein
MRLDLRKNARRDEDLVVFRLPTQAGGEIGHRTDRAVIETPLEPDGPDGRVAARNADPETECVAALLPAAGEAPTDSRMTSAMRMACNS